ncbi:MAG TPA: glycosyltransferase family 25 protein, partial [Rhabdochlamydiaceae bacterium]|nr:glycosyltransferase family 25 protein [Rhabdochlamydiaceae bacterium]
LYVNRFSAVDGRQLTNEDIKSLRGNYDRPLTKGMIGCLLSHISLLKEAYDRGYNVIWVLEDDIEIVDDIRRIPPLLSALYEIDPDWDVFYTDIDGKNSSNGEYVPSLSSDFRPDDFFHHPLSDYLKREIVGDGIMRIGQRFCTHSLIISRKGIEKIFNYFTHVYLYSQIDIDMHYIPGIRQYSVVKDIVSVNPAPSDCYSF